MSLNDYNGRLIESFIRNLESTVGFLGISTEEMNHLKKNAGPEYRILDLRKIWSPFKPFLHILKETDIEDELLKKYSYSVQYESLSSFFRDGVAAERYDIPLSDETNYERSQIIQTLINLTKEKIFGKYILLNAQCMFSDSVELIEKIEESENGIKGKFIFCYNPQSVENSSDAFSNYIKKNSTSKKFLTVFDYDWEKIKTLTEDENKNNDEKNFLDFNEFYNALHNNRIFMAIDAEKSLLTKIEKSIKSNPVNSIEENLISLEIALCYISCGQEDEAILYLSELIESEWDKKNELTVYFYLAYAFYKKKNPEFAQKYLGQLYKLLEKYPESPYNALARMLDYFLMKRFDELGAIQKYTLAVEALEKFNLKNNLINIGLSIPWSIIDDNGKRSFVDEEINRCFKIANDINNLHSISSVCHWKGIICSHFGEAEEAMNWYEECNRIRTAIGERRPILNIRNGLSYEETNRAKYKKAYNNINDIVEFIYETNDYSIVIDTLKNINYALFYSRHFDEAYEMFKLNMYFLESFNMSNNLINTFLPSMTDLKLFKTIIEMKTNDVIHAKINYASLIKNFELITNEDRPLLKFLYGLILLDEGKWQEACSSIEDCLSSFKMIKNIQNHKMCFVCFEFADSLKKAGMKTEAENYVLKANSIALAANLEYYKKDSLEKYLNGIEKFDPLKINLKYLKEKAEKEVLLLQLHKKIFDYQFLNKIKTENIQAITFEKYIDMVMNEIYIFSGADSICIGEEINGEYKKIFSIKRNPDKEISDFILSDCIINNPKINGVTISKKADSVYYVHMTGYGMKMGAVLWVSDNRELSSDFISTLNIAFTSIQTQIVIYRQNEDLKLISKTDQLSQLNNRHALQEYLALESERILRYKKKRNVVLQITIAFIDLDNFKYYNDHFGHSAGDTMISEFGKLLTQTCRKIDFVARFGGDEFVVVMIDTSEVEGLRIFERLRENLEKQNYFIPILKDELKNPQLKIPEEKRIGFSMGISTNLDIEESEDLNKVMINADKALYYVKNHKKGNVCIWPEIMNEVEDD